MSLSPQNQEKLSQYKERNFPPYYRFFVKVLKGVVEIEYVKLDSQVKSISCAIYEHGGFGFVKAQLELQAKKDRILALLHRLDEMS